MRNPGLEEAQAGIKIAGRNINNLRYADDTTLMAESEKVLSCVWLFVTPWTVHWILQARILEWIAFPISRGSSQPRDRTQVSHIAGRGVQSSTINWQISCLDQRSLWCGKFVMQNCCYEQSYFYLLICMCMYFSWVHITYILLNYRAWIHLSSVDNAKHFCKLAVPIYCSTSRLWGFSLLYATLLLFL